MHDGEWKQQGNNFSFNLILHLSKLDLYLSSYDVWHFKRFKISIEKLQQFYLCKTLVLFHNWIEHLILVGKHILHVEIGFKLSKL